MRAAINEDQRRLMGTCGSEEHFTLPTNRLNSICSVYFLISLQMYFESNALLY